MILGIVAGAVSPMKTLLQSLIMRMKSMLESSSKLAKTSAEIRELLEVEFRYVTEKDGLMLFRKRK
jgi:hypothetical protein